MPELASTLSGDSDESANIEPKDIKVDEDEVDLSLKAFIEDHIGISTNRLISTAFCTSGNVGTAATAFTGESATGREQGIVEKIDALAFKCQQKFHLPKAANPSPINKESSSNAGPKQKSRSDDTMNHMMLSCAKTPGTSMMAKLIGAAICNPKSPSSWKDIISGGATRSDPTNKEKENQEEVEDVYDETSFKYANSLVENDPACTTRDGDELEENYTNNKNRESFSSKKYGLVATDNENQQLHNKFTPSRRLLLVRKLKSSAPSSNSMEDGCEYQKTRDLHTKRALVLAEISNRYHPAPNDDAEMSDIVEESLTTTATTASKHGSKIGHNPETFPASLLAFVIIGYLWICSNWLQRNSNSLFSFSDRDSSHLDPNNAMVMPVMNGANLTVSLADDLKDRMAMPVPNDGTSEPSLPDGFEDMMTTPVSNDSRPETCLAGDFEDTITISVQKQEKATTNMTDDSKDMIRIRTRRNGQEIILVDAAKASTSFVHQSRNNASFLLQP